MLPGEPVATRIRVPKVITRDGYGWAEHVSHRYASGDAELCCFYRGIGHWLALTRLIGGSDLHAENLIAAGPIPVVVDCETVLTPQAPEKPSGLGVAVDRAQELLGDSVLRSGLLPGRGVSLGWRGVDMSAVGSLPGQQPSELDPRSVADRVVMVLQDPMRWPHDARANIRVGRHDRPDPDDGALLAAAELAAVTEVIDALPKGWDTLLSTEFRGGHELSGGQWQRLAVARGLYRDGPLLIWDEPTAALDAKAEFAVYETLRRIAGGRTVILITHRLASVRNADRICLVHDGRITEEGTHEELLAAGGRYADLYSLQARMYAATPEEVGAG